MYQLLSLPNIPTRKLPHNLIPATKRTLEFSTNRKKDLTILYQPKKDPLILYQPKEGHRDLLQKRASFQLVPPVGVPGGAVPSDGDDGERQLGRLQTKRAQTHH